MPQRKRNPEQERKRIASTLGPETTQQPVKRPEAVGGFHGQMQIQPANPYMVYGMKQALQNPVLMQYMGRLFR